MPFKGAYITIWWFKYCFRINKNLDEQLFYLEWHVW